LLCAYLFWDLLLYANSGYQMTSAFIPYLFNPRMFLPVLKTFNVWILILPALLFLAAFILFFAMALKGIARINYSSKKFAAFFLFAILVFGATFFLPDNFFVKYSNSALKLCLQDLRENVLCSYSVSPENVRKTFKIVNEKYEYLDKEFPLMKRTSCFSGEKLFNIKLNDKKPLHIIFIFLESFRAKDVGCLNKRKESITPFFDNLSKEGVLFTNFYCNGSPSSKAVVSTLYSVFPIFDQKTIQENYRQTSLYGIPNILQERQYAMGYFSGAHLDAFQHNKFFRKHGFESLFGLEEIKKLFPDSLTTFMGVYDYAIYNCFLNWIMQMDKKKLNTFSSIFSLSNHYPFFIPDGKKVYSLPNNEASSRFMKTMRYTDLCLSGLIKALKKLGLYKKSLIVILGDHGQTLCEHGTRLECKDLYEESVKVPLLLLAPGKLDKPRIVKDLCSSIDLMPTMLDILRAEDVVNSSIGRSLMRKLNKPVPVYFVCPYQRMRMGMRMGDYKFIYNKLPDYSEYYDLVKDPEERNNLADNFPELTEQYKKQMLNLTRIATALAKKNKIFRNNK